MNDTTTEVQAVEPVPAEDEVATAIATSEPADVEHQADEPDGDTFPRDYVEKLRKEAATHRKEAATLAAQVEALQRQQVEATLGLTGVKPAALWAVTDLDALIGEDGTVDTTAVAAAVEAARDQLGIRPIGKGNIVPGIGIQPQGTPKGANAFVEAFKPQPR